jgi:hypothetical protein
MKTIDPASITNIADPQVRVANCSSISVMLYTHAPRWSQSPKKMGSTVAMGATMGATVGLLFVISPILKDSIDLFDSHPPTTRQIEKA